MHYYIISGESSGDFYGSKLIQSIKKSDKKAKFTCWGGINMKNQNVELVQSLNNLSFVGFWEVFLNIKTIIKNFFIAYKSIRETKPDLIILIDYPGFNFRIARFANKLNIPVFWFVAPQVWAWKEGRVKYLKKYVTKLFVIFPFELDYFLKKNIDSYYFGHPLVSTITLENKTKKKYTKPVIALMPGSRLQEVESLLPEMLSCSLKFSDFQFVVIGVSNISVLKYKELICGHDVDLLFDKEILKITKFAIVCSGTASLELMLYNVPQVVCYKISWISFYIAKYFANVSFISIVNILASKKLVPELIQSDCNPTNICSKLRNVMKNENNIKAEYSRLIKKFGRNEPYDDIIKTIQNYLRG